MGALKFNELRITPDGKELIIDVSVKDIDTFSNVYLDTIVIDDEDTYFANSIVGSSNPLYTEVIDGNQKRYRLVLTPNNFNALTLGQITDLNHLFFVSISIKAVPAGEIANLPCDCSTATVATVTNLYPLYNLAMQYIKSLGETCDYPKEFVDTILKIKGLELAVKTGNYTEAIELYKNLIHNKQSVQFNRKGCGCGK